MGADDCTNIGSGDLEPTEIGLVERLLEIIAVEGLVKPELLEPHAKVDDIGFTIDDLTLIGNAIEREYDCDMMPDEAMQMQNRSRTRRAYGATHPKHWKSRIDRICGTLRLRAD